jgi:Tfp pilus assembly protein PilX
LLLCLIILTVLALIGLSASRESIMQERLASNLKETEAVRQAALAAQIWAEDWLLNTHGSPPEVCPEPCDGLFLHAPGSLPPHPEYETWSWWANNGHEAGIDPLGDERLEVISGDIANPPRWVIEMLHEDPGQSNDNARQTIWYRILVRSSGRTSSLVSVVESIVVRAWPCADKRGRSEDISQGANPETTLVSACGRVAWRELR